MMHISDYTTNSMEEFNLHILCVVYKVTKVVLYTSVYGSYFSDIMYNWIYKISFL